MASPMKPSLTEWSATNATSVTPSDSADLSFIPRGIYVGGSGHLAILDREGESIVFSNLAAGVIHPLAPKRVLSTGTTATNIVAVA